MKYKFDRELFASNVHFVVKEKNLTLKKVEEDAGVAPGYISRLRKDGSTTVPTIEFVTNVSISLGVSLAVLLSVDLSKTSSREVYLAEFFDKLITKSSRREIKWEIVDYDFNKHVKAGDPSLDEFHPLEGYTEPRVSEDFRNCYDYWTYFDSKFCGDSGVEAMEESYQFKMPKGATFFLMKVHYGDNGQYGPVGNGYEVYIADKNNIATPITHSMVGDKDMAARRLENLHSLAAEYCKVQELDSNVRGIIDEFMEG